LGRAEEAKGVLRQEKLIFDHLKYSFIARQGGSPSAARGRDGDEGCRSWRRRQREGGMEGWIWARRGDGEQGIPGKAGHPRPAGACAAPQDPVGLGCGWDFPLETHLKSCPDRNHQTHLLWPAPRAQAAGAVVPGRDRAGAARRDDVRRGEPRGAARRGVLHLPDAGPAGKPWLRARREGC